ncbi:MAG: riboflavin synthase [Gammaproteobacteria bacterium]|nr:riboflavin synthase [Gammaproteobacteria bacterium]
MFTGIIQAVGTLAAVEPRGAEQRLRIATGVLDLSDAHVGDSIAVSGVCLTATVFTGDGFWCDVSGETLARTTLGELHIGSRVNLETALLPTTRLGGHLVSGHVDGVGCIVEQRNEGQSLRVSVEVPKDLAKYIAVKCSVCVNGVSLTVNEVSGVRFTVNLVPHTLQQTTLGDNVAGTRVNIEVDLIARYLERLLER